MQLPRPARISTDPGVNESAMQWADQFLTQLDKGFLGHYGAASGQGLVWNGTAWVPTALATLDANGKLALAQSMVDAYVGASTATLTLTTTATLVTGATFTAARTGTYLIVGTFDVNVTVAGIGTAVGQLFVGGSAQAGQAIMTPAAAPDRKTISQSWIVSITAGNAAQLRASKTVNAGTATSEQPHTRLVAILVGP